MADEPSLPFGVCQRCFDDAIAAVRFRNFCTDSRKLWNRAIECLDDIPKPAENVKSYYLFLGNLESNSIQLATNFHNEPLQDVIRKVKRRETRIKLKNAAEGCKIPCQCSYCSMKFSMPYYLSLHLKNTPKNACNLCGKVMDRKELKAHLARIHDKYIRQCEQCYDTFDNDDLLMDHLKSEHAGSQNCKVCGHGFFNERALRAHAYAHSLFHCRKCMKSFENRRCFKYHQSKCRHVALEQNFSSYSCDYCGNEYAKKPSLRIHIIQKHMHVLPYSCSTCGKRTSTLAHLKTHEQTHVEFREVFACDVCGAQMKSQLGFMLHKRIHTGEKPYECGKCGDRFLSASRRLDHMKRRHGSDKDMPHKCDQCTARFLRPCELKKHVNSFHPIMNCLVLFDNKVESS